MRPHYTGIRAVAYLLRKSRILVSHTAFLSPAAAVAFSPHQSMRGESHEKRWLAPSVAGSQRRARILSRLPIVIDCDDRKNSRRRQLLAMHELR